MGSRLLKDGILKTPTVTKLIEACLLYKRNFKLFELYEETISEMGEEEIKQSTELFTLMARATNLTR